MKKNLIIVGILLLICPALSFAQGKFLSKGMKWTELHTKDRTGYGHFDSTFRTYEIVSDTMINEKLYYSVSANKYSDFAFLRESADSMIYILDNYEYGLEKLLYNFSNWEKGDSLYFFYEYRVENNLFVIKELDSLLLKDNSFYPLIKNVQGAELLYGIGFRSGFFTEYLPKTTCPCITKLLTFYRNGELLYDISDYSAIKQVEKGDYLNFVTIENGQIIFQLKEEVLAQLNKINIYSLQGTLVNSTMVNNKNRIGIDHLPKGIYMYQIIDKTGKSVTTGKINLIK